MKTTEKSTLDTFSKVLIAILFIAGFVGFTWIFNEIFIKKYTAEDFYIIKRTDTFPPKMVGISKNYKLINFKYFNQFVPIKTYSAVGNEFFFTVEMMDSTFLKDYTDNFIGIFRYEGLRTCVGITIRHYLEPRDSTRELKSFYEDDYTVVHNNKDSKYPDTLYYKGLKVYNIETWTYDKYIERLDSLTETDSYDKCVVESYGLPD